MHNSDWRAPKAKRLVGENHFLCKWLENKSPAELFSANEIPEFICRTYLKGGRSNKAADFAFVDRITSAFAMFMCTGIHWEFLRISRGSDPSILSP